VPDQGADRQAVPVGTQTVKSFNSIDIHNDSGAEDASARWERLLRTSPSAIPTSSRSTPLINANLSRLGLCASSSIEPRRG